jgi:hypothetical protein
MDYTTASGAAVYERFVRCKCVCPIVARPRSGVQNLSSGALPHDEPNHDPGESSQGDIVRECDETEPPPPSRAPMAHKWRQSILLSQPLKS